MQYERKTEFRRLCDLLRTHLQNVARYSHHTHAINLTEPDTLQRHLDTRFSQLNSAVELELWQEAFRSVEDVHNLLTMAKKAPRPSMMANYYEKLTRIFMVSDNNLFHAAAWNRYYSLARGGLKTDEEHTRMSSLVLLSALAVPVISSSAPGTGNMNKSKSDFLLGDQETRSRTGRLTSLLGLSRTPTRAGLLKEALARNVLKRVRPELRELYHILEVEFHPLSICAKIEPIIAKLAQDPEMVPYVKPLHSVILTRLFQQLSQVYDAVKLARVMELVGAFQAPYNYTAADIEKFVLNACKKGHLDIRVDHVSQAITFQDDVFAAEQHPAAAVASGSGGEAGDVTRLQQTPGELVRTQLGRLASCLDTTVKIIDPSVIEAAQAAKRDVFARAVAAAEQEHKAAVARKAILARRKELLDERAARKEKDEATAKAERQRLAQAAEQKRMEDEKRNRELERIRKEMEAVKHEEAKKLAQNLKEKGGLKLSEEEYATLDTEKLVQLQVEQIEKEKKELAERLRVIHRRMDHLERAYRREETPLIAADYERQKEEDKAYHSAARTTLIETTKAKHAADLELKKRLQRIMPDYIELRKVIEGKRKEEMEARKRRADEQIEEEKQKRREQAYRDKAEAERAAEEERQRAAEEAERAKLREEEEARQAEQRALEQEKQAEREAEKRAEIEARQARLREQGEKQRQRELEVEERLRARTAAPAAAAAPAAPAQDASVWRKAAPAGAIADARNASPAPPLINRAPVAAAGGGWREREAARKAALANGEAPPAAAAPTSSGSATPQPTNGTASPLRAPPAAAAPAPAAAAPAPARQGPPTFTRGGAPGMSWREREAAKKAAAAAGGEGADAAPTPAQAAAAPAAQGGDGFQEVPKRSAGAYR
jgi:translation initiation factor 3 subunit A